MVTVEFYAVARYIASRSKRGVGKTSDIIYDPRFTSDRVISELRSGVDASAIDIPGFYEMVFKDLDYVVDNFNCLEFICNSEDIGEPIERGDFLYYAGTLTHNLGVLYMQSSHPWALPSRAVLYGIEYQIEFSNDKIPVFYWPVSSIKDKIMLDNKKDRKFLVTEYLRNTDRPVLDGALE